MDRKGLLDLFRGWDRLGWAVQAQMEAVVAGEPVEAQNPSALEMIADYLRDGDRVAIGVGDDGLYDDVKDVRDRITKALMERRGCDSRRCAKG